MKKPKIYSVNITASNGTKTRIVSEKKDSPTLQEVQDFVGGYITMAPILNNRSQEPLQLLVDEEGEWKKLLVNPDASATAGYPILGNAYILRGKACWK
jgi:hypothetical protein